MAGDKTCAVVDVHLSSWRLSNAVKYTPQPNLLPPLMGACDGFVKAALSTTLPNDPCGEKIPLGAVRNSVTRIDVLINHFDYSWFLQVAKRVVCYCFGIIVMWRTV